MANIYTYDDFLKAVEENGLSKNFSDADLALARANPDAGMSILNYKLDWRSAKTDEARALAHQGAEAVRSRYSNYNAYNPYNVGGTYSAGSGDSSANVSAPSPGDFSYEAAPEYSSSYEESYQKLLDQMLNREAFSYDPENDVLYNQYRKQYAREGQRSTADALGQAAAASGGIPSSYADTAAAQAGNYYAGQMADKLPELYQAAYQRYLSGYDMSQSDLAAVRAAAQDEYSRYLDRLEQYNTARGNAYQQYLDEISSAKSWAQTQASYGDYRGLANLGVDAGALEADSAYQRQLQANELRQSSLNEAITVYQATGDYSRLEALGIDVSHIQQQMQNEQYEHDLAAAVTAADYGDYTRLYALGISPNMLNVYRAMLANSKYYVGEVR